MSDRLSRRIFCLLAAIGGAPALAQGAIEPIDVVKAFYVQTPKQYEPYSRRLKRLQAAAHAKSKQLDQPVSGIDFEPTVNGQDVEDGFQKTLRYEQTQRGGDKARIKVTFRNGRDSELWFDMVTENGAWVVDDIRSVKGESRWIWSKLLADGAKGK